MFVMQACRKDHRSVGGSHGRLMSDAWMVSCLWKECGSCKPNRLNNSGNTEDWPGNRKEKMNTKAIFNFRI